MCFNIRPNNEEQNNKDMTKKIHGPLTHSDTNTQSYKLQIISLQKYKLSNTWPLGIAYHF